MSNSASTQIAVGKRLTIVDKTGVRGVGSDGQSLRGQNVNDFPDGALFWVRDSNRFYKLKKNQSNAIVEDTSGFDNVCNGIGSSAVSGRFVAVVQMSTGTLVSPGESSPATVVIAGFDTNPGGWIHVSYIDNGSGFVGTPGSLMGSIESETEVRVTSSSDTDGNDVFVTYYETPSGE